MAAHGKTWWGERFLAALDGCMDTGRLSRGRSYAAPHRRTKFAMRNGTVKATMRGNVNRYFGVHETPYYKVEIQFTSVTAGRWRTVLKRIGSNANWVTHLILGEVPPTIEDAFSGLPRLLPTSRADFVSSCSCPDWANPCKHVAGVYYHLGSLLDRDPLLLFELRGMQRSRLLRSVSKSELGAALAGDTAKPDLWEWAATGACPPVEMVEEGGDPADVRSFWRGVPLPKDAGMELTDPPVSALLIRRAGDYPDFWLRHNSFLAAMAELYERVSKSLPVGPADDLTKGRLL